MLYKNLMKTHKTTQPAGALKNRRLPAGLTSGTGVPNHLQSKNHWIALLSGGEFNTN
jgi:hypothetical protein